MKVLLVNRESARGGGTSEPRDRVPRRMSGLNLSKPLNMKTNLNYWICLGLSLALPWAVPAADVKPLDAKPAGAKGAPQASLTLKEFSATTRPEGGSRKFSVTHFKILTGTQGYTLQYASLPDEEARNNPKDVNDGGSGYRMIQPDLCWYGLDAAFTGMPQSNIKIHRGQLKVLKTEGDRVGYDLGFETDSGKIVVRTVAVGGRDELFLSVKGTPTAGTANLEVLFRGYPMSFAKGELSRWVHTSSMDIENKGVIDSTEDLDVGKDHWALFADHNFSTGKGSQLGLVWIPGSLDKGIANHWKNYGVGSTLSKSDAAPEQRFMFCHLGAISWEEAKKRMAEVAKDAPAVIQRALDGWETP